MVWRREKRAVIHRFQDGAIRCSLAVHASMFGGPEPALTDRWLSFISFCATSEGKSRFLTATKGCRNDGFNQAK
jgi:hypothetical protein